MPDRVLAVHRQSERPGRGGLRPAALVLRGVIRLYRLTFSAVMGRTCRYLPTCSDYADEAIGRFGAWAGGWMALARVLRCHPLGASGYDPVPEDLPPAASWYKPWRYGRWTGRHITLRQGD